MRPGKVGVLELIAATAALRERPGMRRFPAGRSRRLPAFLDHAGAAAPAARPACVLEAAP